MNELGDYCKKCVLKENKPNVYFDENGLCNICKGDALKGSTNRFRMALRRCLEYEKNVGKNSSGCYDCLLMLSGGKDSIYMLTQLLQKDIRVLPFTLNHPYESKFSSRNIEKCIEKLPMESITYALNTEIFKKILRDVFMLKENHTTFHSHQLPCAVCTCMIQLSAYFFARKLKIPYVLYCADPIQMTTFPDLKELVQVVVDISGLQPLYDMFDQETIDAILAGDEDTVKIVYPYANVKDYNAERIIDELKEKGLYESSPYETHCSLYSVLNYYSFCKNDNMFYSGEIANSVRAGALDRDQTIKFIELYKTLFVNYARKENLTEEDQQYMKDILRLKFGENEDALNNEFNNILNMTNVAKSLGIDLELMMLYHKS